MLRFLHFYVIANKDIRFLLPILSHFLRLIRHSPKVHECCWLGEYVDNSFVSGESCSQVLGEMIETPDAGVRKFVRDATDDH